MAKPSRTFRLDALLDRKLEEAARSAGLKVSNFVEQAVAEKLGEGRRLSAEIAELRSEVKLSQENWALAIESLLIVIGSGERLAPEDAQQWVKENIQLSL